MCLWLSIFGALDRNHFSVPTKGGLSKRFKVLERVSQVLHFLFCNPLDIVAPWLRNGAQVDLPSSMHYANGYFHIIVAFKPHIQYECAHAHTSVHRVFLTRDSKHYIRRSFWDECRRVSRCPHQLVSFLVLTRHPNMSAGEAVALKAVLSSLQHDEVIAVRAVIVIVSRSIGRICRNGSGANQITPKRLEIDRTCQWGANRQKLAGYRWAYPRSWRRLNPSNPGIKELETIRFKISAKRLEIDENVNGAHFRTHKLAMKWFREQSYCFRQSPQTSERSVSHMPPTCGLPCGA